MVLFQMPEARGRDGFFAGRAVVFVQILLFRIHACHTFFLFFLKIFFAVCEFVLFSPRVICALGLSLLLGTSQSGWWCDRFVSFRRK